MHPERWLATAAPGGPLAEKGEALKVELRKAEATLRTQSAALKELTGRVAELTATESASRDAIVASEAEQASLLEREASAASPLEHL